MRYLGVDYGKKWIGVAISDEEGKIAFPHGVVHNIKDLIRLVRNEQIKKIVLGLPTALNGEETSQTEEVRKFADSFRKKVKISVEFENELLTTRMVEGEGVTKEHVDESAAAVILQAYLDKENSKFKSNKF